MNMENKISEFKIHFQNPMRVHSNFGNDIQVWHELIDSLDQTIFQSIQGPVQVKINWGNAKSFVSQHTKRVIKLAEIKSIEMVENQLEEYKQGIKDGSISEDFIISCSVINPSSRESIEYVVHLLDLIFLTMNLASPGSCSLSGTKISLANSGLSLPNHTIFLSGFVLDEAIFEFDDLRWPHLETIPIKKVWDWIQAQKLTETQFSSTNIQRAIFALLYVCTERPSVDSTGLLWLAYALESLFDTPEQGISKALRDRIFLVLGSPTENIKGIKRKITSFYELRSAFVHGESEIPNPAFHHWVNGGPYVNQLIKSIGFGVLIIVASLQKLILQNWHGIQFTEQYSGISIDTK